MTDLVAAYESEIQLQIQSYEIAVDRAIRLLQDGRARASTHVAHNLAGAAVELAVIAARVEAAQIALSTIKAQEV